MAFAMAVSYLRGRRCKSDATDKLQVRSGGPCGVGQCFDVTAKRYDEIQSPCTCFAGADCSSDSERRLQGRGASQPLLGGEPAKCGGPCHRRPAPQPGRDRRAQVCVCGEFSPGGYGQGQEIVVARVPTLLEDHG
eukprot:s248_g23.t1